MESLTLKHTLNTHSFASTNSITKPLYTAPCSLFRFTCINRFKPTSTISFCYQSPSNSINPKRESNKNRTFVLNPLWVLAPIFRSLKGFASSQSLRWVSRIQSYRDDTSSFSDQHAGDYCKNGAFGVALLSVTGTAKVKISPFVATLAANHTFVSGLFAWAIAQSIKMFLNFFIERQWDFRILCASGGMPSSHSALCMALTTSVALCHGVADSLFPVCLGFSLIVMYDAIGVRRHAGMQAEVLNLIIRDLFEGHPVSQRKLKELLGHTPSQVLAGAVLGIIIACVCCQGCFIAT